MGLRDKLNRAEKSVSVTIDGETYHFARLSALQKDRFDLQWANYRSRYSSGGEGLRGFVVAFCESDQAGNLANDSGNAESATDAFIELAREYMAGDAGFVEPLFEVAARANRIIESEQSDVDAAKN